MRPRTVQAVAAVCRSGSGHAFAARHWHKYVHSPLPPHHCFMFRGRFGATGRSATNMLEFHHEIERAGPDVIQHHVGNGDFSRWARGVIKDEQLAAAFEAVERAGERAAEDRRRAFLRAIEDRYR